MQPKSSFGQQASSTANPSGATEKRDNKQTRPEIENRSPGQARIEPSSLGAANGAVRSPLQQQQQQQLTTARPALVAELGDSFGAPARVDLQHQVDSSRGQPEKLVDRQSAAAAIRVAENERGTSIGLKSQLEGEANAADTNAERRDQVSRDQQTGPGEEKETNRQQGRRQVEQLGKFRSGDYNDRHELRATQVGTQAAANNNNNNNNNRQSSGGLVRVEGSEQGAAAATAGQQISDRVWALFSSPVRPEPSSSSSSGQQADQRRQQISCGLVDHHHQQPQEQQRPTRTTSADEQAPSSSQGLSLPAEQKIQRQSSAPANEQQLDHKQPSVPLVQRQQRIKVTLSRPRTESCEQEPCEEEQLQRQEESTNPLAARRNNSTNNHHHHQRRFSPSATSHLSDSSSQVNFAFGQSPRTRGQSTATLISGSIEQIAGAVGDPVEGCSQSSHSASGPVKRLSDLVAGDRPSGASQPQQQLAFVDPPRLSRSEQENQLRRIASERRNRGFAAGAGVGPARGSELGKTSATIAASGGQQQQAKVGAEPKPTQPPQPPLQAPTANSRLGALEAADRKNFLLSTPTSSSKQEAAALNCTASVNVVSPPPDRTTLQPVELHPPLLSGPADRGSSAGVSIGGDIASGLSPTKQLAIYINGKIRSNSIFCSRSASSNSFTGILKSHFHSNTTTNNTTGTSRTGSKSATQTGTNETQQSRSGSRVRRQSAEGEEQEAERARSKSSFVDCLIPRGCKRTKRGSSARTHLGLQSGRQDGQRQKLTGARWQRSPFHWLNRAGGFNCKQWPASRSGLLCHCCAHPGDRLKNDELDDKQLKIHEERDEEEQDQDHNQNEQQQQRQQVHELAGRLDEDQNQEQETEHKTYKLNPSSMFLRKAMRYYRLWIYSANLIILLGAIIFVLSAIYVTTDYRFQLVVAPARPPDKFGPVGSGSDSDGLARGATTGNGGAPSQSEAVSSDQQHKTRNHLAPAPPQTPPEANANEYRYSFSIGLNEPVMVLAYLMIAVQLGLLQAIGCFGAIRMKERLIQAFWYLILALILVDVMILVYWLQRYDVILKSLRHEMTTRLNVHYGVWSSPMVEFISSPPHGYDDDDSGRAGGLLSANDTHEYRLELDKTFTQILDQIQASSHCCGISNSLDYKRSQWRRDKISQLRRRLEKRERNASQNETSGSSGTNENDDDNNKENRSSLDRMLAQLALVPASCCRMTNRASAGADEPPLGSLQQQQQQQTQMDVLRLPIGDQHQATKARHRHSGSSSHLDPSNWSSSRERSLAASWSNGDADDGGDQELPERRRPNDADNDGQARSAIVVEGRLDGAGQERAQRRPPTLADVIDRRWSGRALSLEDENENENGRPLSVDKGHHRREQDRGQEAESGDQLGGGGSSSGDNDQDDDDDDDDDENELGLAHRRPYSNKRARFVTKQMHYESLGQLAMTNSHRKATGQPDSEARARRALSSERRDKREAEAHELEVGESDDDDDEDMDLVGPAGPYLSQSVEERDDERDDNGNDNEVEDAVDVPEDTSGEIIRSPNVPDWRAVESEHVQQQGDQSKWVVESKLDQRGRVLSRLIEIIDTNNKTSRPQQTQQQQHQQLHGPLTVDDELDHGLDSTTMVDRDTTNAAEAWTMQLKRLRQLLFVTEMSHQANVSNPIDKNTTTARFVWPNELGLNYGQFKLLESYLNDQIARASSSAPHPTDDSGSKLRRRSISASLELDEGGQLGSGNQDKRQPTTAQNRWSKRLALIRELVAADSQLSCLARSHYDEERIYTRGCQPQIRAWLQSSANILFITGFCVLTVLKFCSLILLRLEIREMIHKIRVLRGMATEYNALQDLEPYLPRPSVCAQAAELTPTGVSPALGGTGAQGLNSPTTIGIGPGGSNQTQQQASSSQGLADGPVSQPLAGWQTGGHQTTRTASCGSPTNTGAPLVPVPRRLGGSFSEAVAAAAAVAHQQRMAEQQQQQLQRHLRDYERAASFANCARAASTRTIVGGASGGTGTSMGCSCAALSLASGAILNAPGSLCPCSSSMSMAAHLNHSASQLAAASQQQRQQAGAGGGPFRSDLFPAGLASMPRRHTAVSVCPAAAAAAAAAAHHLMMRRGTFAIANPLAFTLGSSNSTSQQHQYQSSSGGLGALSAAFANATCHSSSSMLQAKSLNYLNQHRHSAHAVPPSHLLFRSSGGGGAGGGDGTTANYLLPSAGKLSPFRRPSSLVPDGLTAGVTNTIPTNRKQSSSNQLDPAGSQNNPPFKRQVSGGAQSAVNFSLDIAPVQLTESRRSIH